jgi:L-lactate dehydrogenase complex protein LldE
MTAKPRRVHLFIPCFVDQLYPETGVATVRLLREVGCDPVYDDRQTCCGQPAFNSGYHSEAAHLARRFLKLFESADTVVAPSASCVGMVRRHYGELGLDGEDAERWEDVRGRIFELSEFLVGELGVSSVPGAFPHKVAYHASCHGFRELGILDQPLELLKSVRGIDLVELKDRHACCGFGGTFAAKFSALSVAMGEDKVEAIRKSGAEVVTATDDSCLMHIGGMLRHQNSPVKWMHYAQILAAGLEEDGSGGAA